MTLRLASMEEPAAEEERWCGARIEGPSVSDERTLAGAGSRMLPPDAEGGRELYGALPATLIAAPELDSRIPGSCEEMVSEKAVRRACHTRAPKDAAEFCLHLPIHGSCLPCRRLLTTSARRLGALKSSKTLLPAACSGGRAIILLSGRQGLEEPGEMPSPCRKRHAAARALFGRSIRSIGAGSPSLVARHGHGQAM